MFDNVSEIFPKSSVMTCSFLKTSVDKLRFLQKQSWGCPHLLRTRVVGAINYEINRSDRFFCGAGSGGVTEFFGGRGWGRSLLEIAGFRAGFFLRIFSSSAGHFPESPVHDSDFSGNLRVGPEDPGCVEGVPWGLSSPHPHGRGEPPPPEGRPRGGTITDKRGE